MEPRRFDAFISYSHAADGKLAPHLQTALARFAKPWYRLYSLRIFRDETTLDVTPELWPTIKRALTDSHYFILLASPASAASKWVQREVNYWLELQRMGELLIVLTDGTVVWDDTRNDFDWTSTNALPKNLSQQLGAEPLYLDLTWARSEQQVSTKDPRFRTVTARLGAKIKGISIDELIGEDVRQHKIVKRFATAAVLLLIGLTTIASLISWQLFEEQKATLKANSQSKFESALRSIEQQHPAEAVALLAGACRLDPSNLFARSELLALLIETRWWYPENTLSLAEQGASRIAMSPRGDNLVVEFVGSGDSSTWRLFTLSKNSLWERVGEVHSSSDRRVVFSKNQTILSKPFGRA